MVAISKPDFLIETAVLDPERRQWNRWPGFTAPSGTQRIKLLADQGQPILWMAGPAGPGSLAWGSQQWGTIAALEAPPNAPTGPSVIAIAGEQTLRAWLASIDSGALLEVSYDSRNGARRGEPGEIPALIAPPAENRPAEWIKTAAAVLLLMVFWHAMRRRTLVEPESLEKAGIILAPIGRRFLAACIDALPIIATVAVTIASTMKLDMNDQANVELAASKMLLPYYLACGVYILHTLLTELLWGWTIGKRICGLRTAMVNGAPVTRRAVVIRNLMRIVDVAMFLPPMLVLLSPLRQRVGDVAGETIVVLASSANVSVDVEEPTE